jgi:hypothetical protein
MAYYSDICRLISKNMDDFFSFTRSTITIDVFIIFITTFAKDYTKNK